MNFAWVSISMHKFWQGLLLFGLVAGSSCVPKPQAAPLTNFMARAEPLIAERRYSEAAIMLDEAAQAHPKDPLPLLKLGQIYLTQHRWLLAEDAFNRALACDPRHPLAMAGLAETLYNQGRLTEALKLWQEVTTIKPDLRRCIHRFGADSVEPCLILKRPEKLFWSNSVTIRIRRRNGIWLHWRLRLICQQLWNIYSQYRRPKMEM